MHMLYVPLTHVSPAEYDWLSLYVRSKRWTRTWNGPSIHPSSREVTSVLFPHLTLPLRWFSCPQTENPHNAIYSHLTPRIEMMKFALSRVLSEVVDHRFRSKDKMGCRVNNNVSHWVYHYVWNTSRAFTYPLVHMWLISSPFVRLDRS